jgi:hypothetical protein
MAMTEAQREQFTRQMQEYNASHGIGRRAPAPLPAEEPHPGDSLGLIDAARRQWQADPQLRVEFGDSFERYLAFFRADKKGLVKIYGRGRGA